jgi:transcriptional regulator
VVLADAEGIQPDLVGQDGLFDHLAQHFGVRLQAVAVDGHVSERIDPERERGPHAIDSTSRRTRRAIRAPLRPAPSSAIAYVSMTAIDRPMLARELKKGSAELIILSIVANRPRHGYEISRLIETQSAGQLKFHVASLYPLLYRLEERGWLQGRWVEKAGERRRRFYRLTAEGRRVLESQRDTWKSFVTAMRLITGVDHA